MKQIEIRELDFPGTDDASRAALHARLAAELDFPPYYGANLDALNDCLEELGEPLDITFVRASEEDFLRYEELIAGAEGDWTWFDKLCRCFERATRENDELEVTFTHEPASADESTLLCDFDDEDTEAWD